MLEVDSLHKDNNIIGLHNQLSSINSIVIY